MSVEPAGGKVIWPIEFTAEDYHKVCNNEAVTVRGLGQDPVELRPPHNAIKPFLENYRPPGYEGYPEYFHVFLFKKNLNKPYKSVSSRDFLIQPTVSPRGWFIVPRDETKGADFMDAKDFNHAVYKFDLNEE